MRRYRCGAIQALPSLQLAGHDEGGSQVSPDSTTPLPQLGEQSESFTEVQPLGQHPSPDTQVVMALCAQATLQLALLLGIGTVSTCR